LDPGEQATQEDGVAHEVPAPQTTRLLRQAVGPLEAPGWVQDRGLEWAYRLAKEPRRLWRRYLVGNAVFLRGLLAGVEVVQR
ncbi:MAG TPA: WecB/TagA/CpsF family glycosyltransferase, partial [Nitriliruptorales bacterium]|nr:WecB/TagA/CpsF family glycosyltransferase [Nitriliruptorales bacterium]